MPWRNGSPGSRTLRGWFGKLASQLTTSHDCGPRIARQKNTSWRSWRPCQARQTRRVDGQGQRGSCERNLKTQGNNRLLVYDTDGANPYGRELAALLCRAFQLEVLASVQAEWNPPHVFTRRILPSNSQCSLIFQVIHQLHGLAVAARADAAGTTILLVMTRGWYDQLAFALMAVLGARVVVLAHDPKPKQTLSPMPRSVDGCSGDARQPWWLIPRRWRLTLPPQPAGRRLSFLIFRTSNMRHGRKRRCRLQSLRIDIACSYWASCGRIRVSTVFPIS